ncbi:Rho guanine nucleotide exchange factor [Stygiomarasmius scandens]|uniref:Rho guanine nucleotide exchange factor n=1 Tax=Marasmiellus scandens TaxID=2682957 RepID=A0ABR1IS12_9AGAR
MACEGPDNMKLRKYRTPGGKPSLSEDIRGVGNLRSASEDFTLLSVNENHNGVHGFRAASSESDLSRALRPNILLSQVEVILNDKAQYKRLLTQQGDLAQSILDLLQSIYDFPDTTSTLRSKTLSAMMHLSKKSGLYPNCLVLDNVTKIGEHPVAAGGFGEIWRGLIGGQMACLKVVKVYSNSDVQKLLKEFFKEAILWRQLDHPNVLPFLGLYFLDDSTQRVCLISPWMPNGNLRHFLSNNPDSSIDRARLVHDVACGICYLHEKKIVHGDLKGENILITVAGRATIADFGLARKVADTNGLRLSFMSTASHPKGSARWMAPECLLQGAGPTYRSDIYAFACVCYEIFTGLVPFHELPQDVSVIFQLSAGKRPLRPPDRSQPNDSVWKIIQECWSQEPSARPVAGILPGKIITATSRVIEPADVWDGLLSSQLREVLRRTAQHVDLCPPGSQLAKFLFEFPPELLTHSAIIHDQDVPSIPNIPTESELEPIMLPNPHEKPLPSIPNMHNPAILTTFQTAMGGDVRRDWEWNDLVTNGIRKNLSENETTRQWQDFFFSFLIFDF